MDGLWRGSNCRQSFVTFQRQLVEESVRLRSVVVLRICVDTVSCSNSWEAIAECMYCVRVCVCVCVYVYTISEMKQELNDGAAGSATLGSICVLPQTRSDRSLAASRLLGILLLESYRQRPRSYRRRTIHRLVGTCILLVILSAIQCI